VSEKRSKPPKRERSEPRWVPRPVVDAVHADLVRTVGGSFGIRDEGLLESALHRPMQRWAYDAASDLALCAAAYCVGLARSHAFVDGNKRTAFQVMYVFLGLNGQRLVADGREVVGLMVDVATGAVDEAALAAWIRGHCEAR
jgi:death on curing protein